MSSGSKKLIHFIDREIETQGEESRPSVNLSFPQLEIEEQTKVVCTDRLQDSGSVLQITHPLFPSFSHQLTNTNCDNAYSEA